jgi:hypothetical protein
MRPISWRTLSYWQFETRALSPTRRRSCDGGDGLWWHSSRANLNIAGPWYGCNLGVEPLGRGYRVGSDGLSTPIVVWGPIGPGTRSPPAITLNCPNSKYNAAIPTQNNLIQSAPE